MTVLGEELTDRNVALGSGHRFGGGPSSPRRGGARAAGGSAVAGCSVARSAAGLSFLFNKALLDPLFLDALAGRSLLPDYLLFLFLLDARQLRTPLRQPKTPLREAQQCDRAERRDFVSSAYQCVARHRPLEVAHFLVTRSVSEGNRVGSVPSLTLRVYDSFEETTNVQLQNADLRRLLEPRPPASGCADYSGRTPRQTGDFSAQSLRSAPANRYPVKDLPWSFNRPNRHYKGMPKCPSEGAGEGAVWNHIKNHSKGLELMCCLRLACRLVCCRFAPMVAVVFCFLAIVASEASAQCETCGATDTACADGRCGLAGGGGLLKGCGAGGCGAGGCGLAGRCQGDGTHCGMPAPSYPVPFATPKNVTRTTFTYPPMMPHHSLPHYAGTYSFRHGPGMSRTTVNWRPTKGLNALHFLHHLIEIPR